MHNSVPAISVRRRFSILGGLVATLFVSPVRADLISVSAAANIYGAGHSSAPSPVSGTGGLVPPMINMTSGGYLTFQVTGQVSYNGGGNFYGADGGVFGPTLMDAYAGISGIQHDTRRFFLVGVFLNNQEPSGAGPITLNYSADNFVQSAPALNQQFFIGDGLTGTGNGNLQRFVTPNGATRLFLGFADGFDFAGPPAFYGDNVGSLSVTSTIVATPEPSSLLLMAATGITGAFGYLRRRRITRKLSTVVALN